MGCAWPYYGRAPSIPCFSIVLGNSSCQASFSKNPRRHDHDHSKLTFNHGLFIKLIHLKSERYNTHSFLATMKLISMCQRKMLLIGWFFYKRSEIIILKGWLVQFVTVCWESQTGANGQANSVNHRKLLLKKLSSHMAIELSPLNNFISSLDRLQTNFLKLFECKLFLFEIEIGSNYQFYSLSSRRPITAEHQYDGTIRIVSWSSQHTTSQKINCVKRKS